MQVCILQLFASKDVPCSFLTIIRFMSEQLAMFGSEAVRKNVVTSEWGTFKDSLKAPVHGWFTYPAGFSYKAVQHSFHTYGITAGMTVYDPFMGSGTTNLVAKTMGINSYGVEAHPMVFKITRTKMNWELERGELLDFISELDKEVSNLRQNIPSNLEEKLNGIFPELLLKCYLPETLLELWVIREFVFKSKVSSSLKDFLEVGLIASLRIVSIAATGWPYIAPNKIKITSMSKKGFESYRNQLLKMMTDIETIRKSVNGYKSSHHIFLGDSRDTKGKVPDNVVDHIFTSPPYLNNFDYADRTRLEMYFMGEAQDWGEISDKIRTKLITCATTQISRNDPKYNINEEFRKVCPDVCAFLDESVTKLGELRKVKGGKKSYDLMVAGYFNDLFLILKDNFRVMKEGATAVFVLGDSAPYGVHIPTDELIGRIAKNIGFQDYEISVLRTRGDKWKDNPQRHSVALRESMVVFKK